VTGRLPAPATSAVPLAGRDTDSPFTTVGIDARLPGARAILIAHTRRRLAAGDVDPNGADAAGGALAPHRPRPTDHDCCGATCACAALALVAFARAALGLGRIVLGRTRDTHSTNETGRGAGRTRPRDAAARHRIEHLVPGARDAVIADAGARLDGKDVRSPADDISMTFVRGNRVCVDRDHLVGLLLRSSAMADRDLVVLGGGNDAAGGLVPVGASPVPALGGDPAEPQSRDPCQDP